MLEKVCKGVPQPIPIPILATLTLPINYSTRRVPFNLRDKLHKEIFGATLEIAVP